LGLYDFAFKTANLAFTQITDIVSRVAFPLYVKRKNDKNHLRNLFFQNVIGVSIPAFVIMIPLLLFPKEILHLLFGPKWIAAALPLQILSIYGFFRAAIGPGGPLFLSIGKPDVLTKINTLNFILVIIFLYPFAKLFGVNGVAWSMTLSYLIITPIYIYFSVKYFKN
jgi:O-antigen/teichoic acid export membrane protein